MIKLNLGCGKDIHSDYKNYDKEQINLNVIPLPFPDDYADEILLSNVFEFLDVDRVELMKELHRILNVGGVLKINSTNFPPRIHHKTYLFNINYFDFFCIDGKYTKKIFEKKTIKKIDVKQFIRNLWCLFWLMNSSVRFEFRKVE